MKKRKKHSNPKDKELWMHSKDTMRLIDRLKNVIIIIKSRISKIDLKLVSEKNKLLRQELIFERNNLIKEEELKTNELKRHEIDSDESKKEDDFLQKIIEKEKKLKIIQKNIERNAIKRELKKSNLLKNESKFVSTHKENKAHTNVDFQERTIDWNNVRFLDYSIFFELSKNNFSAPIACELSRRSFNFLRKYFGYKRLSPLKARFKDKQPIEILNIEELKTVLEILQIEEYVYFDLLEKDNIKRVDLSKLNLQKENICKIYMLYSKSIFFDHLIHLHNDKFKVIPIPEVILNNSLKISKTEDSFIFSFQKNNLIYLVWESVVERKATYIFMSSTSSYERDIQVLFDFIASPEIKNKRERLIYNRKIKEKLKLKIRLLHSEPQLWVDSIRQV